MLRATSKFLSFSALAFAVLSGPSFAEASCDLSDGFGLTPAAFLEEANSCLEGVEGIKADTFTSTELSRLAGDQRSANGLGPVDSLDSLSEAARLHAYDMAFRGYAAHEDLEGRTHLDRVRLIDRSHLISSFGANVVVVKAGTSPQAIQKVLLADRANASNFKRGEFNHMGIAAVEADGMIYVVELFARVDGQLDTPMPMTAVPRMNLAANFGDKLEPVGWSVVSANGQTLMRGLGNKLPSTLPYIEEGFLQMDVEIGKDVYTLKGPAISSSL